MRPSLRARPKAFLDPVRRQWQFEAFAWLLRGCGGLPRFLDTLLVLPIDAHVPESGMKGHAAAAALFRCVRDHAGMADWPCVVEPAAVAPTVAAANGVRVIRYPSSLAERGDLVAHFAHELARFLVESLDEPPPGGASLYAPAVDLAAVFLGFGVFMANSSARHAAWDLNEGELVHALALFCRLRKIPEAQVVPHLDAHVRKYLRLALEDLAQYEPDFRRLRSIFAVVPLDVGECTLPTRGG